MYPAPGNGRCRQGINTDTEVLEKCEGGKGGRGERVSDWCVKGRIPLGGRGNVIPSVS